jgi:tetratricopeptide (TPR) repeat protein
MMAYCLYFLGQPLQAIGDANAAVNTAREVNFNAGEVFAVRILALTALELGEPANALEYALHALKMARVRGRNLSQMYALMAVARAHIGLQQPDQAREYLLEAYELGLERAHKIPQLQLVIAYIHSWLCFAHSLEQDWEHATECAIQALEIREANTNYHGWFFWGARNAEYRVLARAGVSRKRLERDLEHFQNVSHDNPRAELSALHAQATLEQAFGSNKSALRFLQQAHTLALELDMVMERLEIEREIAAIKK